ncbi:hypothetical protein BC829DRAFT_143071 [Chytridium lagenaria]|nr:hypothetical protein BC829DRAFT_143071 [Chytridium lagenaria]
MEERDKSISVPMTPKELERPRKFLPPSSAYTKCPTPLSASTALTDVSLSHDTTDGIISKLDVSITPIGRARNSALTTLFKSAPSSKSFASSNTPNCTTPIKPHFISNLPSRPRSPPTPAIKPQAFHVTAFNPTTTRSTIMSLLDIRKPTSKSHPNQTLPRLTPNVGWVSVRGRWGIKRVVARKNAKSNGREKQTENPLWPQPNDAKKSLP